MEDDTFLSHLIFSDEATFHLSGKVNRHNVRIWGLQNPQEAMEHGTPRKLMCFVLYRKQRFMDRSLLLKTRLLG